MQTVKYLFTQIRNTHFLNFFMLASHIYAIEYKNHTIPHLHYFFHWKTNIIVGENTV